MAEASVTLFVEQLPGWVRAAPQARLATLETLITRGRELPPLPQRADAARMALLGAEATAPIPAGALTRTADSGRVAEGYWLRADPITLHAGLTQVYLTGAGMADFDPGERLEIIGAVEAELARQGLQLQAQHPERWTLQLPAPLPFHFTPLNEALGADVAELLPAHAEARAWRRLMNDLQVALHNHPVNEQRRHAGRVVVNGVWFWGGGRAPARQRPASFQRVLAEHPLSAGLARCFGIDVSAAPGEPGDCSVAGGAVLIDWPAADLDPSAALQGLEHYLAGLRPAVAAGRVVLRLFAGNGRGWQAGRSRWHRCWKRRRPLAQAFGGGRS